MLIEQCPDWEAGRQVDFHCHSCYSDGSATPAELLLLADKIKLKAVALTDHDTVSGIPEFLREAEKYPDLEAWSGVEISTDYFSRELHIVGLLVDHHSEALLSFLEKMREQRKIRNEMIQKKLFSLGYQFSWDEPEFARVEFSNIGRPHFAGVLVRKYGFANTQEVFQKLLGHSRPAYVRRKLPTPEEAVKVIRQAGGVPVWAHPVYRERNERRFVTRLAKKLRAAGLEGIEGFYSMFGKAESTMVQEIAQLTGLAVSGGSDFHGTNFPEINLGYGHGGLRVPSELMTELKERQKAVRMAESTGRN